MVNTNRLMFANDYQRLQLIFAWLLSPYYPNFQSFTRIKFRNLQTINAKRKPSSDFLFDLKAERTGFEPVKRFGRLHAFQELMYYDLTI